MPHQLTPEQKRRNRRFNQGFDDGYENRKADAKYQHDEAYFRGYNSGVALREEEVAEQDD